jgi:transcription antitermination factor NusB
MAKRRKPLQGLASTDAASPDDSRTDPTQQTVRKRTRAREMVLRALYLVDIRGAASKSDVPQLFREDTTDPDVQRFAKELFEGCLEKRDEIDAKIAEVAENWQIHRMAVIHRNVLRLGTYEILYLADIPPKVSINEAIYLAKRYSTAESGAFVNGILDKLRLQNRPEPEPPKPEEPPAAGDQGAVVCYK